jgi:lysyl-tRNA synthetase, class I
VDNVAQKTWIEQAADTVEKFVRERKGIGSKIICASGISPSGPIHLGNLREAITVHLITEELKRRGWDAEHIHSWDDFDRLRKIPADVPASFAKNIGKPLADVPDPYGDLPSYAYRFRHDFEEALLELGIKPTYIVESEEYRQGRYTSEIIRAIENRSAIFDILSEHQTLDRFEKDVNERREEYYPIRVYCESCGKDDTVVKGYTPETATVDYSCLNCKTGAEFSLFEKVPCKLVWKVDWPMRWSYYQVDFEPGGEDHAAPGSSYTVGKRIVKEVYEDAAPSFIPYAFVGMSGRSKISSSAGTNATPKAALDILEPSMIRWLYVRKNPMQKFNIDFGQEVLRLYDEWDTFEAKVLKGNLDSIDSNIYKYCVQTSIGPVNKTKIPVSFRLLSSAADITQGYINQIVRIAADQINYSGDLTVLQSEIEPRLTCAVNWATRYLPEDERTHIRENFSVETYEMLDDLSKNGLEILLSKLDENWTLEGLTLLIYNIPKVLLNLPLNTQPTNELKQAQRQFFKAIYSLICGSETGPRIPTLFLSLGQSKVKRLLYRQNM